MPLSASPCRIEVVLGDLTVGPCDDSKPVMFVSLLSCGKDLRVLSHVLQKSLKREEKWLFAGLYSDTFSRS